MSVDSSSQMTPQAKGRLRPPPPLDLPILAHLRGRRVVLASASPRRRMLLGLVGLRDVEVVPSKFAEDLSKEALSPHEYVAQTAQQKGLMVYKELVERAAEGGRRDKDKGGADDDDADNEHVDRAASTAAAAAAAAPEDPYLVIAADTVVCTRAGRILEKPRSEEDHRRMLRLLRDSPSHSVLTAVCCIAPKADASYPGYTLDVVTDEATVVFVSEADGLSDAVIDSYVRTREGCDKAGGYAIQGAGGILLVDRIEGTFDTVVGLPVRRCIQLAEKVVFGRNPHDDNDDDDDDDEYTSGDPDDHHDDDDQDRPVGEAGGD